MLPWTLLSGPEGVQGPSYKVLGSIGYCFNTIRVQLSGNLYKRFKMYRVPGSQNPKPYTPKSRVYGWRYFRERLDSGLEGSSQ